MSCDISCVNYGKHFTDYSFLFSKYIDLILSHDKGLVRDLIDILHVPISNFSDDSVTFEDSIASLRAGYKKLHNSVVVCKNFKSFDSAVILDYRMCLARIYTEYIRTTIRVFVMPVEINYNYMIGNGVFSYILISNVILLIYYCFVIIIIICYILN